MLATGTTLGCGLTICLAVFPTEAKAAEVEPPVAAVYRFDDWTMIVQPGNVAGASPANSTDIVVEPRVLNSPRIELASFRQLPPAPNPLVDTVPKEKPSAGAIVTPADTAVEVTPKPVDSNAGPCPVLSSEGMARVNSYRAIYDSIPFSRAEYEANPSYRHDATMEFLFGQMRPTVIQRQQRTQVDINMPSLPYYGAGLQFNRYGIHNRWSPYMYPPYRW